MRWIRALGTVLFVACSSSTSTSEEPVCSRACLVELGHGLVTGARALSADARMTENGVELPLSASWLERAAGVNIHGEYADVSNGAVAVIGTGMDTDGRPTVFGLRLRQEAGEVFRRLAK